MRGPAVPGQLRFRGMMFPDVLDKAHGASYRLFSDARLRSMSVTHSLKCRSFFRKGSSWRRLRATATRSRI